MAPSFVTWPTRNMLQPLCLARCISIEAHSRTWETLPGALAISGLYIVCMESTIITLGESSCMRLSTVFMSFSGNTKKPVPDAPSRFARILIWRLDSSPET